MGDRTGSPNRNKTFLLERLRAMYGEDFDPMIRACENAIRMSEIADIAKAKSDKSDECKVVISPCGEDGDPLLEEFAMRRECVNAWDKIAQYVTPKLKSVDVSGSTLTLVKRIDLSGGD